MKNYKTAKGTQCPITNKEYPMSKERKGNRLSCPWKLDLSVGYWILKMGENAGLVVTP